jgi:hypothetical protein
MGIYQQPPAKPRNSGIIISSVKFLTRFFNRESGRESESNISRALRAVVESDSPAVRRDLHNALTNQRLILPVPSMPSNAHRDATGRLQWDAKIDFLSFQDRNGRKLLAVFTSPQALAKWKTGVPTWIAVDAPSLCRLALQSGQSAMQINPGNPTFVELSLEEIRMLAEADAGR